MDKYATPSKELQEQIVSSLVERPKHASELVDEGIASERSIRAAISYMKEQGRLIEHHRGDWNRVYYSPVGKPGDGVDLPRLKVAFRGNQWPLASIMQQIKSPALQPLKWILQLRLIKSVAKRTENHPIFANVGAYAEFVDAIDFLERNLQESLDLVTRIRNTPIVWAPDDGYLWEMAGIANTENNILSLILSMDDIKPLFDKWMKEQRERHVK